MYAQWEDWFDSVAEQAEKENSEGKRAHHMDTFKEEATEGAGLVEQITKESVRGMANSRARGSGRGMERLPLRSLERAILRTYLIKFEMT